MTTATKHHIYLIGPRGCGKTTVGQLLAKRLQWHWIDLDQMIQEEAGQSVAEIFAQQGQAAFRDMESNQLLKCSVGPARVISLGGGAVLRPENQSTIQATGHVVFLNASIETLVKRIAADPVSAQQRPSLVATPTNGTAANDKNGDTPDKDSTAKLTEEVQQILSLRMPVYQQTSDLLLDTSALGPEEIVDQISRWLPLVDRRFSDLSKSEHDK